MNKFLLRLQILNLFYREYNILCIRNVSTMADPTVCIDRFKWSVCFNCRFV